VARVAGARPGRTEPGVRGLEELDAHMAAEERTFLSPVILREDQIRHPLTDGR
jgi:hypothetical protein